MKDSIKDYDIDLGKVTEKDVCNKKRKKTWQYSDTKKTE